MPATQPFFVYRDRIGPQSEIGFLRRQYVGFTRLHPIWIGRTVLPNADAISPDILRLGGGLPLGPINRLMFRHLGVIPAPDVPDLAPILHAQFARGGALALPLAKKLSLSMVVTLHGGDITKQKNWRGTVLAQRWKALVREASGFICVSNAVADVALSRGVPEAKLTVLPIGVEIPGDPPARRPTAHLFVGRFVEKKGIAVLADAMRRLRAAGDTTPLVCVGDGPLKPMLEALATEIAGLTLTGWLPPDAVRVCMNNAVSLLVPSIIAENGDAEGLPSVIPEAMAQACPVIGSDQGGIAEAITHDHTGLLVPPGDAEALAHAMNRITRESGLADRLGTAGFNHAATDLNASIQSAKLEAILMAARRSTR